MRLGESHGLKIHVAGAVGSQREKNTWLGILLVGPVLCFDLRRGVWKRLREPESAGNLFLLLLIHP